MSGNVQALFLRRMSLNCVRYVSGFSGLIAVGFDWPAIEVIARSCNIKMNSLLLRKMRKLEDLEIRYFNKKDGE